MDIQQVVWWVWDGLMWLWIWTVGGLLWMR